MTPAQFSRLPELARDVVTAQRGVDDILREVAGRVVPIELLRAYRAPLRDAVRRRDEAARRAASKWGPRARPDNLNRTV